MWETAPLTPRDGLFRFTFVRVKIYRMNAKVFCALFLAGSIGAAECVGHDGKAHIELPQYQEAPTLTMFVNSTATFTSYRPFSFFDFEQYT